MRDRAPCHIAAGCLAALVSAGLGGCSMEMARRVPAHESMPGRAVLVQMSSDDRSAFDDGVALVAELKYAEAERRFARVAEWFQATGDDVRASETLFWQGFCREKLGRGDEAWQTYQLLMARYPRTAAARQAAERMRRLPVALPLGPPPTRPDRGRPDVLDVQAKPK